MSTIRRTEIPFCEGRKVVPSCPIASQVLEEVRAEREYLNEQLLPFLREKGIAKMTTKMLFDFAKDHSSFVGGEFIESRTINHPEFLTFKGRKVAFNREAFKGWFDNTDEGKKAKAFKDNLGKEELNLIAVIR